MPNKASAMEYREILRRLTLKQSIRSIHLDTGYSQELIRKARDVAKVKGWFDSSPLPKEKKILKYIEPNQSKAHPLDKIKEKIKQWVELGYTYIKGCFAKKRLYCCHYDAIAGIRSPGIIAKLAMIGKFKSIKLFIRCHISILVKK